METETRVMQPQTQDQLESSEAGKGKEGFLPWGIRKEDGPLLFQTFGLENCEEIIFCCFKTLGLSLFVTVATED